MSWVKIEVFLFLPLCSAVLPTGESHQGADWTAGSVHRWAVSCSHWQETLFIWETDFQPLKYGRVNCESVRRDLMTSWFSPEWSCWRSTGRGTSDTTVHPTCCEAEMSGEWAGQDATKEGRAMMSDWFQLHWSLREMMENRDREEVKHLVPQIISPDNQAINLP